MKLWHDDVRPAPQGWTWARTNEEAMSYLRTGDVVECSLDHDLGADPNLGINARGSSPKGTGLDLVRWMIKVKLVPDFVNVHSWSGPGGEAMINAFKDAGYKASRILFNESFYAVP